MIGPLSYLDIGLILLMLLSGMLAMYRGLSRELLAMASWGAAIAAVAYFILVHEQFAQDVANQMGADLRIAQIAIGAVVFLIVLIVVHLITLRLSDMSLESRVGMVDRILAFPFGLLRAFIIVLIPYMIYIAFFPEPEKQFTWVRDSWSAPYLKSSGESLQIVLTRASENLQEMLSDPGKPPG